MKRIYFYTCALLLFIFFKPCALKASHIMGGNMTYTFTGYNAGTNKYQFDIILKMYRYCVGTGTTPLPTTLPLGVYDQDTANPTANKVRNSIYVLSLIESSFINPP